METTHHVNSSANEDAIVERPEEGDKETNEARDEIDPCKILYLKSKELAPQSLTFAVPYRVDDVVLHAEDDSSDDDGSKSRLRDEGTEGHEEGKTEDDQPTSVDSTKRGLHTTGRVDCSSRKRAGSWHGLHK